MGLRHVVVTSVTRDDLTDGGAEMFAKTIHALRAELPDATVEVLIPDFRGNATALRLVVKANPDILGHNIETVSRLYPSARPAARYLRSMNLLRAAKDMAPHLFTKSGLMLGLGEEEEEITEVMRDLMAAGCGILTLGQYLSPGSSNLPVVRYYTPEEFLAFKKRALAFGFRWVESGPLVRSSYHAGAQAEALREAREPS
jgi:lipoic acid synthetase